jgi:hypothetical protein
MTRLMLVAIFWKTSRAAEGFIVKLDSGTGEKFWDQINVVKRWIKRRVHQCMNSLTSGIPVFRVIIGGGGHVQRASGWASMLRCVCELPNPAT